MKKTTNFPIEKVHQVVRSVRKNHMQEHYNKTEELKRKEKILKAIQ